MSIFEWYTYGFLIYSSRKSSRRSSARSRRSSTKDQKVNQEGLKLIKEEKAEEGSVSQEKSHNE